LKEARWKKCRFQIDQNGEKHEGWKRGVTGTRKKELERPDMTRQQPNMETEKLTSIGQNEKHGTREGGPNTQERSPQHHKRGEKRYSGESLGTPTLHRDGEIWKLGEKGGKKVGGIPGTKCGGAWEEGKTGKKELSMVENCQETRNCAADKERCRGRRHHRGLIGKKSNRGRDLESPTPPRKLKSGSQARTFIENGKKIEEDPGKKNWRVGKTNRRGRKRSVKKKTWKRPRKGMEVAGGKGKGGLII